MNAALNILEDSDQYAKAYQIAKAEIGRADSPYYFQADLADVAEKLGRKDEAIQLLDVAYHGSRGPATRFQWGTPVAMVEAACCGWRRRTASASKMPGSRSSVSSMGRIGSRRVLACDSESWTRICGSGIPLRKASTPMCCRRYATECRGSV